MHYFYSFLFLLIVLSANAQKLIVPEPFRAPGTLHPMPLAVTGVEPDVFLPGDSINKPHVRTHIVEVSAFGSEKTNLLIEKIKQEAKLQGLDGVALHQYPTMSSNEFGISSSLVGVGIKYIDNISYIDTIIKQRVITRYLPDGNQGKTVLLDFDWHGNLLTSRKTEDFEFYADSVSMMDLHFIFNRTSPMYTYRNLGPMIDRIVTISAWPKKIVHLVEGNIRQIDYLTTSITSPYQTAKIWRLKISPVYTENRLTGGIVAKPGGKEKPLYYLHYKHDALGRITNERWEKLIDGKRTLWLEVENRFFEADQALILQLAKGKP